MTLEQILPEIRKGRRARVHPADKWSDLDGVLSHGSRHLECDLWELEPEPEVIEIYDSMCPNNPWEVTKDGFGARGCMRPHAELDALHAASLRIRGIAPMSAEEAWERWPHSTYPQNKRDAYDRFILAFKLGQQSALPVVEYEPPIVGMLQAWTDKILSEAMRTSTLEALETMYRDGWLAHEAAMKGGV
jgi:hypothetical protein